MKPMDEEDKQIKEHHKNIFNLLEYL